VKLITSSSTTWSFPTVLDMLIIFISFGILPIKWF
jgi:hypothetical protein